MKVADEAAISVQVKRQSRLSEDGGRNGKVGVRTELRTELVHVAEEAAVALGVRRREKQHQSQLRVASRGGNHARVARVESERGENGGLDGGTALVDDASDHFPRQRGPLAAVAVHDALHVQIHSGTQVSPHEAVAKADHSSRRRQIQDHSLVQTVHTAFLDEVAVVSRGE